MRRANVGDQHSIYEEENQRMENELRNKVSALKSLSINIGEEVRSQNALLNDMDDDMGKVGGFLGSTMKKLKHISRGGYCKIAAYCVNLVDFLTREDFARLKWLKRRFDVKSKPYRDRVETARVK